MTAPTLLAVVLRLGRSICCTFSGCAGLSAVSRLGELTLGTVTARVLVVGREEKALERGEADREGMETFGSADTVLPPTCGLRAGITGCPSKDGGNPLPPPRRSAVGRPPGPHPVPAVAGNSGRKTDNVRLLPSNRSARALRPGALFTGRIVTL